MNMSLETLASASEVVELKPGEVIFQEGTRADAVYRILSGAVAMTIGLPSKPTRTSSAEYLFEILSAGEYLGINFRGNTYSASATALTVVRVERMPQVEFEKFWDQTPAFVRNAVLQLSDKFQKMIETNKENYLASVQERIANTLRILASRFGQVTANGETIIDLHLSRRELAQLSGTIDESVARHLSELKRSGVIREDRKRLIVRDLNELGRLVPVASRGNLVAHSFFRPEVSRASFATAVSSS